MNQRASLATLITCVAFGFATHLSTGPVWFVPVLLSSFVTMWMYVISENTLVAGDYLLLTINVVLDVGIASYSIAYEIAKFVFVKTVERTIEYVKSDEFAAEEDGYPLD